MSVLERIEQRIKNMSTMLTRFGIDTVDFAQVGRGQIFTRSMRSCLACENGVHCTGWLAKTEGEIARVPEFCPNARRFAQTKDLLEIGGKPH